MKPIKPFRSLEKKIKPGLSKEIVEKLKPKFKKIAKLDLKTTKDLKKRNN